MFKEYPKPVASLSMADIPHKLMKDLVENNKFLNLPRLSSQVIKSLNGEHIDIEISLKNNNSLPFSVYSL